MTRRARSRNNNVDDQQSSFGNVAAAGGASALGGALGTAGGMTVTSCPSGDTSFYCTFVKWFNMLKMVLFIIGVIIVIYVMHSLWRSSSVNKRRR